MPFDHDQSIGIAPLGCRAPQALDGQGLFTVQTLPGSDHPAFFAFGFCPSTERDQAAAMHKAIAPEGGAKLVLAGIGDVLGL